MVIRRLSDLAGASEMAAAWAKDDGVYPEVTRDGERRYTVQQGLRNAHVAREDSAAALILLAEVLPRLEWGLWVCLVLLGVILWRVW